MLGTDDPDRERILGFQTILEGLLEAGLPAVEQELAMGMGQPDQCQVDSAYVSAERLAQACEDGRVWAAPASPQKAGRLSVEDFDIPVSGAACNVKRWLRRLAWAIPFACG